LLIGPLVLLIDLLIIDFPCQSGVIPLELRHDGDHFRDSTADLIPLSVFHNHDLDLFPQGLDLTVYMVASLHLVGLPLTGSGLSPPQFLIFAFVLIKPHFEVAAEGTAMIALEFLYNFELFEND
jgi:hypothetical protein